MLYEILKTAKLGATAAPDMFTGLIASKMPFAKGSGEIAELSGVPPLNFKANGQPMLDWRITGNTVQSGTPTQTNPVPVLGVGELETSGEHSGEYKIPILSANTTTPVYFGEVQSTRRIKKLVLTGQENWTDRPQYMAADRFVLLAGGFMRGVTGLCSHYIVYERPIDTYPNLVLNDGTQIVINHSEKGTTTLAQFKQWLAAQYANGTPVTVWYVLATPETAVVNEPLMRIGGYTDSIDMTQAGIQIPTVRGNNILTVGTTVQPSEVYIKYQK